MKFIKTIKRLWKILTIVGQNEEKIKDLEERTFRPKEKESTSDLYSQMLGFYMLGGTSRSISLEEKIDAIAKYLSVNFEETNAKESEVVAKKQKKSKK